MTNILLFALLLGEIQHKKSPDCPIHTRYARQGNEVGNMGLGDGAIAIVMFTALRPADKDSYFLLLTAFLLPFFATASGSVPTFKFAAP